MDLILRERELLARELELARREIAILRSTPTKLETRQRIQNININTLKDMLSDFGVEDIDCSKWKKQFQLLCRTYACLLLSLKLKGKAQLWLHSESEYIAMGINDLLTEMTTMFENRQSRLTLRKKF